MLALPVSAKMWLSSASGRSFMVALLPLLPLPPPAPPPLVRRRWLLGPAAACMLGAGGFRGCWGEPEQGVGTRRRVGLRVAGAW